MKVQGTETLQAPLEKVWTLLEDPQTLAECTPGLTELKPTGTDEYEAVIAISIAAVKGTYKGKLRIIERVARERFGIAVEGNSAAGFVRATGTLVLGDGGASTSVDWSGDVQVGGALTIGARMIPGIAKMLAGQFFDCLNRRMQR
ncbi:MAG: carbon monoxide dehydrogenase subunit G [Armatimonadetes bacterium]|nr:carbon monoxide dehydrogenase subunit G [Armatimonadota bacterium]